MTDKEMLLGAGVERFVALKVKGWEVELESFYPELAPACGTVLSAYGNTALEDVTYGILFPWGSAYFGKRCKPNAEGVITYTIDAIFPEMMVSVYDNTWIKREIGPLEVVKRIIKRMFDFQVPMPDKSGSSKIEVEYLGSTEYWPPFYPERKGHRAWVAVRHVDMVHTPSSCCPTCGHRTRGENYETSHRLILAAWGVGKLCLNAGYLAIQIIRVSDGQPHPLH